MLVGVYATLQLAVPNVVPANRVQLPALLKVPVLSLVKLTVPVGGVGVVDVSVTVAVHVVGLFTWTEPGEQETEVDVGILGGGVTMTVVVALLLPLWVESPP